MRKWIPWMLVAVAFGFSVAVFNRLPERVPIHWDVHGDVNGWGSPILAAFLLPAIMAVVALSLPALPKIDPNRANYEKFQSTYDLVIVLVTAVQLVIHVAVLGKALGWPIHMEKFAPLMVGILFVILGNVLPKARPNWWFGIRTPWTLTNDRVWERTHRLGGYMFVVAGILLMLLAVLPASFAMPMIIAVVAIAAVVPIGYSFVAWRQETSK